MTGADASSTDEAGAIDLRILTPGVSEEEAAAATAVVLSALQAQGGPTARTSGSADGWVRGARPHRQPVDRGPGRWARWGH